MFTLDKLTKGEIFDLETLLGGIPPKDFPTNKEMHLLWKLRGKLQDGFAEMTTTVEALKEHLKPLREAKATDEALNEAGKEYIEKLNALRKEATSVELSDEQLECFKRWFSSRLKEGILKVEFYLKAAEALGVDMEA